MMYGLTYAFSISGFGVISTPTLEQGFRNVDRRFFVPRVRCLMLLGDASAAKTRLTHHLLL